MYKLVIVPPSTEPNGVLKGSNTFIPFAEGNTDYQAFLKYQAEGGKVYGADEEIPADGEQA
jgi:hypothetical protein